MITLNEDNARKMIVFVADKIIESKPLLTEIDNATGDGDHGIGMAGGLQKAKDKVLSLENSGNVYDLFSAAGKAMLMSMGGASGVIFGSMFLAGTKNTEAKSELSAEDFSKMMRKALEEIKLRGKAQVGDKTMVDALEPAVIAMENSFENGFDAMLFEAEKAAEEGMEKTKDYIAKFGRAKTLMERAIGHRDAGATSVYIIFKAMSEFSKNA